MHKRRPCRWTRRRARRQTQVREYPDNQRKLPDGGNDLERPTALRVWRGREEPRAPHLRSTTDSDGMSA